MDGRTERQKLSPSAFLRNGGGQHYVRPTRKLDSGVLLILLLGGNTTSVLYVFSSRALLYSK